MKNIDVEAICLTLEGTGKYGINLASELKKVMQNTLSPILDSVQKHYIRQIAIFAARSGYLELFKLIEKSLDDPIPSSLLHPVIFQYLLPLYEANKEIAFSYSEQLGNLKKFLLNYTLNNNGLLKNFSISIWNKDIEMMRFFQLEKNINMIQGLKKLKHDQIESIFTNMLGRYDAIKYLFQNLETDFQFETNFQNEILKKCQDTSPDWSIISTLFFDHYRCSSHDISNQQFKDLLSEEQKMTWIIKKISSSVFSSIMALNHGGSGNKCALSATNKSIGRSASVACILTFATSISHRCTA